MVEEYEEMFWEFHVASHTFWNFAEHFNCISLIAPQTERLHFSIAYREIQLKCSVSNLIKTILTKSESPFSIQGISLHIKMYFPMKEISPFRIRVHC